MSRGLAALTALVLSAVAVTAASAESGRPQPPPLPRECGAQPSLEIALPNSAVALMQRKRLKILTIGASPASVLGGSVREGGTVLLESVLERSISGLDVEIINRGFSGELASAAAQRIKIEVALGQPDVVLWQVGTSDALAQVPVEQFTEIVTEAVRWLKDHNVDVILVGLHYTKQLAKDPHYQAIRWSLQRIASIEAVLGIGRYQAMEGLSQLRREGDLGTLAGPDADYNCVARQVARAIAAGLFAKPVKYAPIP